MKARDIERSKLCKDDFFFLHGLQNPLEPCIDPVYKWKEITRTNPLSGHSWTESIRGDLLGYAVLGGFDKPSTHKTESGAEKELKRRQDFLKVHQDLWEEWKSLTDEQRREYRHPYLFMKGE